MTAKEDTREETEEMVVEMHHIILAMPTKIKNVAQEKDLSSTQVLVVTFISI